MRQDVLSPAGTEEHGRKSLALIGALVLLVGICLLPEPAPLERAGLSIPGRGA